MVRKLYTYVIHHSEKHVMEQVVYTFWGNKTNCFIAIKGYFVSGSIVNTNIQKTLQSTNTGAEHTFWISKDQMIHNHISHSASS